MTCPVDRCNGTPNPGWTICRPCAVDLEKTLAEIPALVGHLELTLSRQTGNNPEPGARTTTTPLPYDPRASEATWILRSTLVGWIRDLDNTHQPGDDIPAMARWLFARRSVIVVHIAAGELVDEITTAATNAWRAVDRPTERMFLGRCGCDAELWTRPDTTTVVCRNCGTRHDRAQIRDAQLDALASLIVTGPEFAAYAVAHLDVTVTPDRIEGRVRTWRTRNLVQPVAHIHRDGTPMPAYRFADLRARLEGTA